MIQKKSGSMLTGSIAVLLLLSGCQVVVHRPHVQVISLKYASITRSAQTIGVRLSVSNPNAFPIPIQSGSATIKVDGQTCGDGIIPHAVTLPADETAYITVPIRMNVAALKSVLPRILMDGKTQYTVNGLVAMQGKGTVYPFTYSGSLTLPDAEKIVEHSVFVN